MTWSSILESPRFLAFSKNSVTSRYSVVGGELDQAVGAGDLHAVVGQ